MSGKHILKQNNKRSCCLQLAEIKADTGANLLREGYWMLVSVIMHIPLARLLPFWNKPKPMGS